LIGKGCRCIIAGSLFYYGAYHPQQASFSITIGEAKKIMVVQIARFKQRKSRYIRFFLRMLH